MRPRSHRYFAFGGMVVLLTLALGFSTASTPGRDDAPTSAPTTTTTTTVVTAPTVPVAPEHPVLFGVAPDGDGSNDLLDRARATETELRVGIDIVAWFSDFTQPFDHERAAAIAADGWQPAVFWEPWDHTAGSASSAYTAGAIVAGDHDGYIAGWAESAGQVPAPVWLILAPEMNSPSSIWAPRDEREADEFVAAWRRIRTIFDAAGATNVRFVWAPAAVPDHTIALEHLFPGEDAVDVMGMTVFNGGDELPWGGWLSYEELTAATRQTLVQLAPGRPIAVASIASAEGGGDKAAWVHEMFEAVRSDPALLAVIWFDHDKEVDWRVDSSVPALEAFRAEVGMG